MTKKDIERMVQRLNSFAENEKVNEKEAVYYSIGVYHAAEVILEALSKERFYPESIVVEKNGHRTYMSQTIYRFVTENGMVDVSIYDVDISSVYTDEDGMVQYDMELAVAFDCQEVC